MQGAGGGGPRLPGVGEAGLARGAHLPNRQVLRLSGKWAPSSPLRLMVTRRPVGPIVQGEWTGPDGKARRKQTLRAALPSRTAAGSGGNDRNGERGAAGGRLRGKRSHAVPRRRRPVPRRPGPVRSDSPGPQGALLQAALPRPAARPRPARVPSRRGGGGSLRDPCGRARNRPGAGALPGRPPHSPRGHRAPVRGPETAPRGHRAPGTAPPLALARGVTASPAPAPAPAAPGLTDESLLRHPCVHCSSGRNPGPRGEEPAGVHSRPQPAPRYRVGASARGRAPTSAAAARSRRRRPLPPPSPSRVAPASPAASSRGAASAAQARKASRPFLRIQTKTAIQIWRKALRLDAAGRRPTNGKGDGPGAWLERRAGGVQPMGRARGPGRG